MIQSFALAPFIDTDVEYCSFNLKPQASTANNMLTAAGSEVVICGS